MREKYESLPLVELKALAKARGLKGISTMRKPELIERMLEEDKKESKHLIAPFVICNVSFCIRQTEAL